MVVLYKEDRLTNHAESPAAAEEKFSAGASADPIDALIQSESETAVEVRPQKKHRRKGENYLKNIGWVFMIPALVCMIIFVFYPLVHSFIFSFQKGTFGNMQWCGGANYNSLFQTGRFWTDIGNTFLFLVIQVPIMTLLALLIAVLLNNQHLKFKGLLRTCIFLPCVVSLVAGSLIFNALFKCDANQAPGLINAVFGIDTNWFHDPWAARFMIIILMTWRWTGYNMIFFLSGLQNINPSIYESCKIDGSGPVRTFFRVTAPQMMPTIVFVTITSTIGTLQLFDEVNTLFPANAEQVGVETATMFIYTFAFPKSGIGQPGLASSGAFMVMVLVVILSILQNMLTKEKDTRRVRPISASAEVKYEMRHPEAKVAFAAESASTVVDSRTIDTVAHAVSVEADRPLENAEAASLLSTPSADEEELKKRAQESAQKGFKLQHSEKVRRYVSLTFIYIFLLICVFFCLFPLVFMIMGMTEDMNLFNAGTFTFSNALGANFRQLFHFYDGTAKPSFLTALGISVGQAVVTVVICLFFSSMCGYAVEIYRSRGKNIVMGLFVASMMIPFCATMLPLYNIFATMNKAGIRFLGTGSFLCLCLPYFSTAFMIYFFRQNTMYFSKSMIEAARLDGLSEFGIYARLYVPCMKNTFAAAAIIGFMNNWNNYLWPNIVTNNKIITLPVYLAGMQSATAGQLPNYPVIFCGIFLATLPMALVFFLLQKWFVAGMLGSVKG